MSNPHRVRDNTNPPNALSLMQGNGQFTMVVAFRKGRSADWYVRFRQWCWANNVNPTDVFNAIIEPITHFCENFARRQGDDIVVPLNLGDVLLQKFYGCAKEGRYAKNIGKKHGPYPRVKKHQLI